MSIKPDKFPWGTVTKVHEIPGLPPIIEYVVGPSFDSAGDTNYQIECETFGTMSYATFDNALMGSLCNKYGSTEITPYVWRLIGATPT